MLYRLGLLPATALALLVVLASCGGGDQSLPSQTPGDEAQVESVLAAKIRAINSDDWEALYDLHSPTTRRSCAYEGFEEEFSAAMSRIRAAYGEGPLSLRDISVSLAASGTGATVSYITSIGIKEVAVYDNDVFVKDDGQWFDVDEEEDGCADSGEGRS